MATETLRPTTGTSGHYNSTDNAYDGNILTSSSYTATQAVAGNGVWSGFASTTETYTALTLYVSWELTNASENDNFVIDYSLDGGTSWETAIVDTTTWGGAKTTSSVTLSASQDTSDIQVRATRTVNNPKNTGGDEYIFEIWTEGEYTEGSSTDVTVVDGGVTGTFTANSVSVSTTKNVTISDGGNTSTFTANNVTVSSFANATIVDGGNTIVVTANTATASIADGELVSDTGNTITATANQVVVTAKISIAVVDTGNTGSLTSNIAVVTAYANVTIIDGGNTLNGTSNDASVIAEMSQVVTDSGSTINIVANNVSITVEANTVVPLTTIATANFTVNDNIAFIIDDNTRLILDTILAKIKLIPSLSARSVWDTSTDFGGYTYEYNENDEVLSVIMDILEELPDKVANDVWLDRLPHTDEPIDNNVYLVDELGNFLVDELGNLLIA